MGVKQPKNPTFLYIIPYGFVLWKEWINRNYNFGEDNPPLSRIVKEVLGID